MSSKQSPIQNGSWEVKENDTYAVTGVTTAGERFTHSTTSWAHASGINLWRGSKWLVRDGKKYLIQRVYN